MWCAGYYLKLHVKNKVNSYFFSKSPNPRKLNEIFQSQNLYQRTNSWPLRVSHQSLQQVDLLGSGQWPDGVVQEHGEQFGTQPLLTFSAAAATGACTGADKWRLSQGEHSERRVDGKD